MNSLYKKEVHKVRGSGALLKYTLSAGIFLFLFLAFSPSTYAQCGAAQQSCCDNTAPLSAGDVPFLSESLPTTCVCDSGLFCVIGPADPRVSICAKCTSVGDSCCWNFEASAYVCQGSAVYCDQISNKCADISSLPSCSNVGDACCAGVAGGARYCVKTTISNLECNGATGLCYIPGQACGTAPLKCCPDSVDPTLNPGTCLGTDICDATKADATSPKGYCVPQGTCGDLDGTCCTTGDACNNTAWTCLNGYCRADVSEDIGELWSAGSFPVYRGPIISDIAGLLAPVFRILFYTGIFVGILGIIYSGYLLISSEGDPGRVKEGKDQFTAAILGTLFVLLSVFILRVIINSILGVNSGL